MLATELVTAYADELTPAQIHPGTYSQYIEDAQDWSYHFGRMLHASLRDEPSAEVLADFRAYKLWLANEKSLLDVRGNEGSPEDRLHCLNEVNFHHLHAALLPMWRPILAGGWESPQQRTESFAVMRRNLATAGLFRYTFRKTFVNQAGSEALFNEQNKPFSDSLNGAVQEFDAGNVLLDIVQKYPNLLLLAAPLQFERGLDRTCNVDLMVVDFVGKRAVGAQVKSSVHDETVERYDPDRVVLIDGNIDFDNVLSMRTRKGSSSERVVGWPGLLTAKRIQSLPKPGKGMSGTERLHNSRLQAMAKQVLGPIQVDYPRAVRRIEGRILEKL